MRRVWNLAKSNDQYKSAKDAFDAKLNEISNIKNWKELEDLLTKISEKVIKTASCRTSNSAFRHIARGCQKSMPLKAHSTMW